jgi:hypothetical protein
VYFVSTLESRDDIFFETPPIHGEERLDDPVPTQAILVLVAGEHDRAFDFDGEITTKLLIAIAAKQSCQS